MTAPRNAIAVRKFGDLSESLDSYAKHVHELNVIWWYSPDGARLALDPGERYMLIMSELAEAMEGHRKSLPDDKLPHWPMIWVELADTVIRILDCAAAWELVLKDGEDMEVLAEANTIAGALFNITDMVTWAGNQRFSFNFAEEGSALHSVILQCEALAKELGCGDFWLVVYEKLLFNQQRQDHSYEAQALPNGKKF